MKGTDLQSPGKLAVLGIIAAGCVGVIIVGMILGTGDVTAAWATLTAVIGYLIGNGAGARKGIEQQPVFAPKVDEEVKITKQLLGRIIDQVKEEKDKENGK